MNGSCKFFLSCTCALSLFIAIGAKAQDLRSSVGAVCDSQAQAERLVALVGEHPDNPRSALSQLNHEVGKDDACVVAPIHYVPRNKVSRVSNRLGTFDVVEILVIAVETTGGTAVLSAPVTWFAIFQSDDQDV